MDQLNILIQCESDQESWSQETLVGDEQPQEHQQREVQYSLGDHRKETDDKDVIIIEKSLTDIFKLIPSGYVNAVEGWDFWPLLGRITAWKETITKDLAANRVYKISDEWLCCSYGTERASLLDMAAKEERAVRRYTQHQDSFQDL